MLLNNRHNNYINFSKNSDFHIQGLGVNGDGKKGIVDMYFRGVSGGGKLFTQDIADSVHEALGIVVFDREVDMGIIDNFRKFAHKSSITGDIAYSGEEEGLTMEKTDTGALRIGLYKDDRNRISPKKKEIYFDAQTQERSDVQSPLQDMIVVSTQRQFAQLVNLALAIQEYNMKGGN